MVADGSRMYFKVFLSLERPWNTPFWPPNLHFVPPQPQFSKMSFLLFLPNSLFSLQISKSTLYKMFLWTIRTILGFIIFLTLTWFFSIKIWLFQKKSLFEISVKKGDFIGSHMWLFWRYHIIYIPVFLKASGCVSFIGPPAFFFLSFFVLSKKNKTFLYFSDMSMFEKHIFLICVINA